MSKNIELIDLGIVDYSEAWDIQTKLFQSVIDTKLNNRKNVSEEQIPQKHYFLFAEHPHVYTLGRNGKESHLLLDESGLKDVDASFYKINRGGDITYHGYGQVVGYPILDLDEFFTDIGKYIRLIEEVIIKTIEDYGVTGERIPGLSGVWLDPETASARKICAVGVHLSRWTTMHGFALNVNTNLDYFNHIVPCGINDKAVTSLQNEVGYPIDLLEVKKKIIYRFADLFEADFI